MYLFKVLMIVGLCAYSNASLSELDKECEGNIPCRIKAPDYPQEEIKYSRDRRPRRSSTNNPCECYTEDASITNTDPDAPQTMLNELLNYKITQTRCLNEGAKCLEEISKINGRSYICQTKTAPFKYSFPTQDNKKEMVVGRVNVGCDCVYEE